MSAPVVIDGFRSGVQGSNCNRIDPTIAGPPGSNQGLGISANPAGFHQTDWVDPVTGLPDNGAAYALCAGGSCPMPRDRTFTNAATGNAEPWGTFPLGNGSNVLDLNAYWNNHHGGNWPTDPTTGQPITRYQAYLREASGAAPFTAASQTAEPSGPTCPSSTIGNASRRVMNVAVVDCQYWGITGRKPLPPSYLIAQFFMTEPAMKAGSVIGGTPSGGGVIIGEYIGSIPAGDPNQTVIHKIVQLVR